VTFEVENPVSTPGTFPSIARPSFASLLLTPRAGSIPLASATGFAVVRGSQAFLVTNRHVVRGRNNDTDEPLDPNLAVPDSIAIRHHVAGGRTDWTERVEALVDVDGPRWFEHPAHGGTVDVAVLPLTDVAGTRLYPYDPQSPGRPIPYDVAGGLSIVGFPFALQGGANTAIWIRGFVATEPTVDFDGLPRFLVDARTRVGQSGSPVLVYQHQGAIDFGDHHLRELAHPVEYFLGVYSGRVNPDSDLGTVWKAVAVAEILMGAQMAADESRVWGSA
jgi:hypothetical protein